MAIPNLKTPFDGPFYMNGQYAQSFLPSLFQLFSNCGTELKQPTEEERMNSALNIAVSGDGATTSQSVLILNIKQPIVKYSYYDMLGSKSFMSILDRYKNDDSIAGVVLDIDSGGGQVYGTPEFYDYLKNYPKPTGTYTDGYLCSAAYYLANATRFIVANKRADHIGSIGAYASLVNFQGIFEKLGASVHTIYGTKSTRKNFEYRELMDNGNEKPYVKNVLDPTIETFHADMKATRPSLSEEVFTGDTWNAEGSLERNLIDEIGTMDTVIQRVFELANKNSTNKNTNMSQTKNRANLQAVLGYQEPLAATDNGSFLNEQELDAIESHLEGHQSDTDTNNIAMQAATDALGIANASIADVDTALDAALAASEIEVDAEATQLEKITALQNHITYLGKQPGAVHTTVPKTDEEEKAHAYLDFSTSHYQIN